MNKQEVYQFLNEQNITFEVTEHKAVYNMDDLSEVELPHPEADAKNLFIRDDKKRSYYLITVRGDKRVDLKEFRKEQGTRPLSFASAEDLEHFLHLIPGSVTPLGLLNNVEKNVKFFLDSDFEEKDEYNYLNKVTIQFKTFEEAEAYHINCIKEGLKAQLS